MVVIQERYTSTIAEKGFVVVVDSTRAFRLVLVSNSNMLARNIEALGKERLGFRPKPPYKVVVVVSKHQLLLPGSWLVSLNLVSVLLLIAVLLPPAKPNDLQDLLRPHRTCPILGRPTKPVF